MDHHGPTLNVSFDTHPDRYKHWRLTVAGPVATLAMQVQIDQALADANYALKLNSYDLGVDIELADAVQRLRFEHPEVRVVIVASAIDRIFCAGANIYMLQSSAHGFKVNFCKFTNETRLSIEDATRESDQVYLAACSGTASGGGYELAMACAEIHLVDDGNSAVSLPEVPLLGVLPGTGGLTRLVDKRRVRRDRADVFATLAEGIKGKRAVEWRLVDFVHSKSKFGEAVKKRAAELAAKPPRRPWSKGVALPPIEVEVQGAERRARWVTLRVDHAARTANLTIRGPASAPASAAEARAQGSDFWPLRAFRELEDAILQLRFNEPKVGLVLLRTEGQAAPLIALDALLEREAGDGFIHEVRANMARVLRRLDQTARSFFAIVEPGSCFAACLLELVFAADRAYMLDDPARPVALQLGALSFGALPMDNGRTRLATRFLDDDAHITKLRAVREPIDPTQALALGLVTFAPDDIDWDDDVRIAIEERTSLSPDALTGLEQNLRFAGSERLETKIFGRLSAWQNWIFQRPNAVGPQGALTAYGKPERPTFDWMRT